LPTTHQPPPTDLRWLLALFALLLFACVYVHQKRFNSATPVSRLNLLHALVVHGTFRIDAYHQNTPDKAIHDGHYYSDKAPGTVALAFPGFVLAALGLKALGVSLDSDTGWLVSSWVACATSLGLLAALGGVALFAWLCRWTSPRSALVTTLAIFLGAAPLPYATLMFSHALAVGLVALALWAVERGTVVRGQGTVVEGQSSHMRWDWLAGFACGWVLASEFTAGLIVAGIGVWVLRLGWDRALWFALGTVPPLLLIPAYSWVCLGDPFTLPYSHQASFPAMSEGLYAIKWPDPETAYNLLVSPTRGLLFWTPFLVMAGLGYWRLIERSPGWFWFTYALPLLQVIVISGRVWDWQAGFTLGPRYLAPILPLLALPCALGVARFPRTGAVLALVSVLLTTLATLTDVTPGSHLYNPLTELHIPLFLKGEFSPNLGMMLGLPPYLSVGFYYLVLAGGTAWLWWRLGREREVVVVEPGLQAGIPTA
jgi:hypothetical protein